MKRDEDPTVVLALAASVEVAVHIVETHDTWLGRRATWRGRDSIALVV